MRASSRQEATFALQPRSLAGVEASRHGPCTVAGLMARKLAMATILIALLPAASDAASEGIRIWNGSTPATTEGMAVVGASARDLYLAATSYAHWTELFSDVRSVAVESGGRRDAVVRFASRALDHTLTVRFDNVPHRIVRFTLVEGPPGTVASGSYVLEPDARGRGTIVRAQLHADVTGIAGWFVSAERVRGMRERKLRADLSDLQRVFPLRRPPLAATR